MQSRNYILFGKIFKLFCPRVEEPFIIYDTFKYLCLHINRLPVRRWESCSRQVMIVGNKGGFFSNLPVRSKIIKDDEVGEEPVFRKKRPEHSEPQGKAK